jgi:hypothetical protein
VRIVCIAAVFFLGACAPDPTRELAAKRTLEALRGRDAEALWALQTPESQEALLSLQRRLVEAHAEALRLGWTASQADEALGAWLFSGIAVGQPQAGPLGLARLLDRGFLTRDPLPDPAAVALAGDPQVTLVTSPTGGFVSLVATPEGWRSNRLSEVLRTEAALRGLGEAATKVLERARGAAVAARDERRWVSPWGTFNLLRSALAAAPPDLPLVHALLGPDAHTALAEALAHLAALGKRPLRERLAKEARLGELGLAAEAQVAGPTDLWLGWAQSPTFEPPIPPDDEGEVMAETQAGTATLLLASQKSVAFARGADGNWRVAGYGPVLQRRLVDPLARLSAED